jgi:Ca2+-dependent lipid-binding protein
VAKDTGSTYNGPLKVNSLTPFFWICIHQTIDMMKMSISNGFHISRASKKPVGILLVKVVRAQNLRKKDLLGKSDPYVKLKISDDKLPSKKTTVKRSNLNPEWNEDFKFVVTDPETQALEVNVFDWEQVWMLFYLHYIF